MSKVFDYSKLLGRIKEKKFTQVSLAGDIGMSETSLNHKLANKSPFKQSEMLMVCEALEIPIDNIGEYFFRPKLKKP